MDPDPSLSSEKRRVLPTDGRPTAKEWTLMAVHERLCLSAQEKGSVLTSTIKAKTEIFWC